MTKLKLFLPTNESRITVTEDLIKKQGLNICQENISKEWINKAIKDYSFGYISKLPKANIGKIKNKKDDNIYINGFIICKIDRENSKNLWIQLVCSIKDSKIGKELMKKVEETQDITSISLYSVQNRNIENWYKSLGYNKLVTGIFEDKDFTEILMQKTL